MSESKIGRRAFIQGAGLAALGAAAILSADAAQVPGAVPNSAGTEVPKLKAPPLSCDCHQHIYDPARFPGAANGMVADARVAEYRMLQKRLGIQRNIVCTPGPYAVDNSVSLDAISQFGPNARGVAVINSSITDAELETLNKGGVRGIRFTNPGPKAVTTVEMIEPLSKRVHELGWHVDISMSAEEIVARQDLFARMPTPIIFDHFAHVPQPAGPNDPSFDVIRKMLDKGRTYIKLSVTSDTSGKDAIKSLDELTPLAQAYLKAAPERMVWGSNWPHPGVKEKPDDAVLFDLVAKWAPDAKVRHRLLVDNAAVLYGFPK
ncbi:MAG: amidohydrolase family protein [Candidatus Acidiferrales bacterium]|jgi:predicted TIM-barrel fold metal-dependent hydrolase